jgi:hypothetical protein
LLNQPKIGRVDVITPNSFHRLAGAASSVGPAEQNAAVVIDKLWPLAYVVLAMVGTVQYIRYWRPWGLDDAWITFRYARNIIQGHGYVFNVGDRVQGTSTPLYTLYLALAGKLFGAHAIPTVSFITGAICFVAMLLIALAFLSSVHSRTAGLICAFALAFSDSFLMIMTSGMETPIYCLLIIATFWKLAQKRSFEPVLLATLAALTRLDGLALLVVALSYVVWTTRRIPWREAMIPVVLLGGWGIFCLAYFGHLLPQSFTAKQNHTNHAFFNPWMIQAIYVNATLAVFAIAGLIACWRNTLLLPLLAWFACYVCAYSFASLQGYPWYISPATLAEVAIASCGAAAILERVARSRFRAWKIGAVLAAIEMAIFLFPGEMSPLGPAPQGVIWSNLNESDQARFDGSRRAMAMVKPGDTVAALGIGMIGWFTNAAIVDPCGLVTPAMVRRFPEPFFINALSYSVSTYRPDFVFETFADWPQVIRQNYKVVDKVKFGGGGDPFTLWKRRS